MAQQGAWWLVWHRLQEEMQTESRIIVGCQTEPGTCTSSAAKQFVTILNEGEGKQESVRIAHINRAVNLAIRFKEGTPWTSPLETLSKGVGDCKHYALVKYAALNTSALKQEDLQIVVVRIKSLKAQHMVLAVREDRRWLILDNRTFDVVNSRDLTDYEPLYSFDYRGMREFVRPAGSNVVAGLCQGQAG
jgi:predicted transglutaminase-like cysteine proteinase